MDAYEEFRIAQIAARRAHRIDASHTEEWRRHHVANVKRSVALFFGVAFITMITILAIAAMLLIH